MPLSRSGFLLLTEYHLRHHNFLIHIQGRAKVGLQFIWKIITHNNKLFCLLTVSLLLPHPVRKAPSPKTAMTYLLI